MSVAEQPTAAATPVEFIQGALSVQVRGDVPQDAPAVYTVQAESGQQMIVNLIPQAPGLSLGGTVLFPEGQQTGGPGGVVMNQVLTQSGTYTVRVNRSNMNPSSGPGDFILELVILPAYLVQPQG